MQFHTLQSSYWKKRWTEYYASSIYEDDILSTCECVDVTTKLTNNNDKLSAMLFD